MINLQIDHIGYLVKKIEPAAAQFHCLGFECVSEVTHDTIRKVDILFMKKDGVCIELVSPYDKDSVVANLIKIYRNAPYHICYSSSKFQSDLTELQENGFVLTNEPQAAPAFGGRQVAFLFSAKIGLVEILDSQ